MVLALGALIIMLILVLGTFKSHIQTNWGGDVCVCVYVCVNPSLN